DPAPVGLDLPAFRAAITAASRATTLTIRRPDGTPLVLGWGVQLDLREVTPSARRQIEDEQGQITDLALAGYIAKYATKTTGATDGPERPIRHLAHIEHLNIPDHHRR